jgi:tellurite resistance protein TerA
MVDYRKSDGPEAPAVKISLTKSAPTVSLTKSGSASGTMRVNLNWDSTGGAGAQKKRWFGPGQEAIDLDLACLFEMQDGFAGVVQALGESFGDFDQEPYVLLDGDDRSGSNANGENLLINLAHMGEIRRLLIFAFIYDGVPSWDKANGIVTLFPAKGPSIEVRLDDFAGGNSMCAIALIENRGGELVVSREVKYVSGHIELDELYGWDLEWVPGSK